MKFVHSDICLKFLKMFLYSFFFKGSYLILRAEVGFSRSLFSEYLKKNKNGNRATRKGATSTSFRTQSREYRRVKSTER